MPDLEIFTHGLVERRPDSWRITDACRSALVLMEGDRRSGASASTGHRASTGADCRALGGLVSLPRQTPGPFLTRRIKPHSRLFKLRRMRRSPDGHVTLRPQLRRLPWAQITARGVNLWVGHRSNEAGNSLDLVGRVAEIWRYPVSSIGGECIASAQLSAIGVAGDRLFGLIDAATGAPAFPEKDPRWRNALHLAAKTVADDLPAISFPHGNSYSLNEPDLKSALSEYFGFAAAVATYAHSGRADFPITHYRHQHFAAHVLTTASLRHLATLGNVDAVDCRRFRPNILIEPNSGSGFVEDRWIGRRLRLGAVHLIAQEETKRCGVTFISQPGIDESPEVLRNILRYNKRNFGIYCAVDNVGTVHVGDEVFIEDGPRRQT